MTASIQNDEPMHLQLRPLLDRQHQLYAELKSLSDQQKQTLQQGSTTDLLTILAKRQGIVDQLGRLAEELAPLREQWDSLIEKLAEDDRQSLRSLVLETQELAQSVMQQDDVDQSQLRDMRRTVAHELSQVNQTAAARNAYGVAKNTGPSTPPRFADRCA